MSKEYEEYDVLAEGDPRYQEMRAVMEKITNIISAALKDGVSGFGITEILGHVLAHSLLERMPVQKLALSNLDRIKEVLEIARENENCEKEKKNA